MKYFNWITPVVVGFLFGWFVVSPVITMISGILWYVFGQQMTINRGELIFAMLCLALWVPIIIAALPE